MSFPQIYIMQETINEQEKEIKRLKASIRKLSGLYEQMSSPSELQQGCDISEAEWMIDAMEANNG